MIVLRCYGCNNIIIAHKDCVGYCNKCHLQLQYDPRLTFSLCSIENEKEEKRLEKKNDTKKHKKKKGLCQNNKTKIKKKSKKK